MHLINKKNWSICMSNMSMETSILVRRKMILNMVKESTYSKTGVTIKVGGKMIVCMVKVNSSSLMENYNTKDSGVMMNLMDGECSMHLLSSVNLTFGLSTKDKWVMETCMAEVNCTLLMELSIKVSFRMEKSLEGDVRSVLTSKSLRSNGL